MGLDDLCDIRTESSFLIFYKRKSLRKWQPYLIYILLWIVPIFIYSFFFSISNKMEMKRPLNTYLLIQYWNKYYCWWTNSYQTLSCLTFSVKQRKLFSGHAHKVRRFKVQIKWNIFWVIYRHKKDYISLKNYWYSKIKAIIIYMWYIDFKII